MTEDITALLEEAAENESFADIKDVMKSLDILVSKVDSINKAKQELEDRLAEVEKERLKLIEVTIPSILTANGIETIKLTDGRTLSYKEEYFVNISAANKEAAMNWFESCGLSDIIKNEVKVSFPAGEDDKANQLGEMLSRSGIPYTQKRDVHSSTLKSVVNNLIKEGQMPPQDIFSIYQKRTAKVK